MSIESFSLWGAKKIIASDALFPSNYQKRLCVELGSIQGTIEIGKGGSLFERTKEESSAHWQGKIIRFGKRYVCTWAIGLIAAPAGIVVHGYATLKFTVLCLPKIGNGNCAENRKQMKQHGAAFLTDLLFGIFTYTCLAVQVSALANPVALMAVEGAWLLAPIGLFTFQSGQMLFAADPDTSLVFLSPSRQQMIANMKIAYLKNHCGLVSNEEGAPLKEVDLRIDLEVLPEDPHFSWEGHGHFVLLRNQKRETVYNLLKNLSEDLGKEIMGTGYSPKELIDYKKKLEKEIPAVKKEELVDRLKELNKEYQQFIELHYFLRRFYNP